MLLAVEHQRPCTDQEETDMRLLFSQEVLTVTDIAAANDENCVDAISRLPSSDISTWWPLFFRTGLGSFARMRPPASAVTFVQSSRSENDHAAGKIADAPVGTDDGSTVVEKLTQPDAEFSMALNALEKIVGRAMGRTTALPTTKAR